MRKRVWIIGLLIAIVVASLAVWYFVYKPKSLAPTVDVTKELGKVPEYKRLWYFGAIDMGESRSEIGGLDGTGVRVTIMGEEVDPTHQDLKGKVIGQHNAFVERGVVLKGVSNLPYGFENMGYGDGHGTHIAGTIAALSDKKGIEGVASGASLDIYDIGAYDSAEKFKLKGWEHRDDEMGMFLSSFKTALDDVTRRGESRITTGSFNIESPYIPLKKGGKLEDKSLFEIKKLVERKGASNYKGFIDSPLFSFVDQNNTKRLKEILKGVEDKEELPSVLMGILISKSREWKELEESIHQYQLHDGAYIVTESNNIFRQTSLLNAMPAISDKVDKDLWISAVLVAPGDFDSLDTIRSRRETIKTSRWVTLINDCGKIAQDYCIVVPSFEVLSTITEKIREPELILLQIDKRYYQSYSGHSMGAPMIAGALALMEQKNKKEHLGYSMKELVKILKKSANRSFKGYNPDKHGQGMLDVKAALKMMTKDDTFGYKKANSSAKCQEKNGYWYNEICWKNFDDDNIQINQGNIDKVVKEQINKIKETYFKIDDKAYKLKLFLPLEEEKRILFVFNDGNKDNTMIIQMGDHDLDAGSFQEMATLYEGSPTNGGLAKQFLAKGKVKIDIKKGDDLELRLSGELFTKQERRKLRVESFVNNAILGAGNSTLDINGTKAYLNGDLGSITYEQIKEMIHTHPEVKTIVFGHIAGSLNDSVNMYTGRLIREAGLTTEVLKDSDIASGGVDLFCAGRKRIVHKGAKIGVHSWCCILGHNANELPKEHPAHRYQLAYFAQMLGTQMGPKFYFYTLNAAPFDSIHYMSDDEISKWQIATDIQNDQ